MTGTTCEVCPSAIVIAAVLSVAMFELSDSAISNPFALAGAEMVIVAAEEVPPVTDDGLNTTDTSDGWPCAFASTGRINIGRINIGRSIDRFMATT